MKTYMQWSFVLILFAVTLVACPGTSNPTTPPTNPTPPSPTNPTPPTPPNPTPPSPTPPSPPSPPAPTGNVPPELVGIWQDTKASSSDYKNVTTGETFTLTKGYSAQLKFKANGQFYFAHLSTGASDTCAYVNYFDQMTGVAVFQNNQLTLTATERRLDITNCTNSRSLDLTKNPLSFNVTLAEAQSELGEPSYTLALAGSDYTLNMKVLQREPPSNPDQPAQPQGFQLGTDGVYSDFNGLWTPDPGSSTDFYNPQTGAFTIPVLNGSDHRWLRFSADGYETAKVWVNQYYLSPGACKKDLIYYEKGTALFKVTEDVGGMGTHFVGDVRLQASDARLIVNIRDCDSDNGVKRYTLKPLAGYFRWIYYKDTPERISLGCLYQPLNVWQFGVCNNRYDYTGFEKRQ